MLVRVVLAALLLVPAGSRQAGAPGLRRLIEKGRHPSLRWSRFPDVQPAAERLYASNDWEPLWTARGRPTGAAHALLDVLSTANDRGLEAEDYDASVLTALATTLDRGGADAEQATRFDAALTIGVLRLVRALAQGRVPQESRGDFDPVPVVEQLRGTTQPGPVLAALEPSWRSYQALKRALARYRALARDSALLRLAPPAAGGVSEGGPYSGAPRLRRLLGALGDLGPSGAAPRLGDSVFTGELADGIRRFQVRQGAHVDGRLSEATWRLLIGHFAGRIQQMALALERWRWLPRKLAGAPIVVSLPANRLHYFPPANTPEPGPVGMRVRLGADFDRTRPVQSGTLELLVLHPDSAAALGTVRFPVQGDPGLSLHGSDPGALGGPPGARPLVGSVRVMDAELLAELLLREGGDWTGARVAAALDAGPPVSVRLRRRVPVLIVYGTAVARENGQVFFFTDSSGEDRRLQQQLARGYPYGR